MGVGEKLWEVGQMLANKGEKVLHGTCWGQTDLAELKPNSALSVSVIPEFVLCWGCTEDAKSNRFGAAKWDCPVALCGFLWLGLGNAL